MPEPQPHLSPSRSRVVAGVFLVGLQREHAEAGRPRYADLYPHYRPGDRDSPAGEAYGGWILAAGYLGLVAALLIPPLLLSREERPGPGITTDIAAMLMYGVGALLVMLPQAPAVPVGHWRRGGCPLAIQAGAAQLRPSARGTRTYGRSCSLC